jgi:murein DD-endopeptidase MepM/ murein hydrolase activator NlpD
MGLALGACSGVLWDRGDDEPFAEARSDATPPGPLSEATPSHGPIVEVGPPAPSIDEPRAKEGTIARNQFIADVLTGAGASAVEADRAVRSLAKLFDWKKSKPGHRYRVEVDATGSILLFEYEVGPAEVYFVTRENGDLVGRKRDVVQKKEVVEVRGKIERSLYEAFQAAGESESLAMSLADAFRFDIDFFHDTRAGDEFQMFVEKITNEKGDVIGYGRVLAAQYTGIDGGPIGEKRLYWFDGAKARGYYDGSGTAAQRAFLKSPLDLSRVSSGFGYRYHPILKRRHFHGGVDYAAPVGTPVRAIGDGTVAFAARKGAAGNMITIHHSGGYRSSYLHLSRIDVKRGQHVSQSTIIGRVGTTGRSTGPHLDLRLEKNGKLVDPRHEVAPRTKTISASDRAAFARAIAPFRDRFDDKPVVASN